MGLGTYKLEDLNDLLNIEEIKKNHHVCQINLIRLVRGEDPIVEIKRTK